VLAWDGLVSWWIALTLVGLWFCVLTWGVLKAIKSEEREQLAAAAGDGRADPTALGAAVPAA
jgi:hypothetical protein